MDGSTGTDIASVMPSGLTDDEANFVYNVEVLNMPARLAARQAGMPASKILADHIVQARAMVRQQMMVRTAFTREEWVNRTYEAVERAKLLADPMAEIAGMKEIGKALGLYEPQKIDINLKASMEALAQHAKTLPDDELMSRLGASSIIDADFYEVADAGKAKV